MLYQVDRGGFWRQVEEIRQKDQIYRKHAIPAKWGIIVGATLTFVPMIVVTIVRVVYGSFTFPAPLDDWVLSAPLVLGVLFWYLQMRIAWKCELTPEENLALTVSSIVADIKRYTDSDRKSEVYREEAAGKIEELASQLDTEWNKSDLLHGIYGRHFEKFSTYLTETLAPVVRRGDDNQLSSGTNMLYSFCEFLMDGKATLSDLDRLHLQTMKVPPEQTLWTRAVRFFMTHPVHGSVICGIAVWVIAVYFFSIPGETAFLGGITVFAALLTYFSVGLRGSETRESTPQAKQNTIA